MKKIVHVLLLVPFFILGLAPVGAAGSRVGEPDFAAIDTYTRPG